MIKVYRSSEGVLISKHEAVYETSNFSFDALFRSEVPLDYLTHALENATKVNFDRLESTTWLPPLESQEVWASGVTYFRSREARMEESEASGGDVFYNLVYDAERPELFFKSTARRARGHGALIRVRADSSWDVPEPELTLAINASGHIFGYTVGNDVSSRDIEGQNPLYLPQAKVYRGSCALGPALCVGDALPKSAKITLEIEREGTTVFSGNTEISQIKRSFDELAEYLFRENDFPDGCLLMTGTGIVPSTDFTLSSGDRVSITIDGLGTLVNPVE